MALTNGWPRWWCVLAAVAIGACAEGESGVSMGTVQHPTPENMDRPAARPLSQDRDGSAALRAVAQRLAAPPPRLATIGDEGDGPDAILGQVRAVAELPSGDVAVLDERVAEVKRFSANGQFQGLIARAGQGPGELRAPFALFLTPDDSALVVLDRVGRAATFSADDGRLIDDVAIEPNFSGACPLGDTWFLSGWSYAAARPIVGVDQGGEVAAAIGTGYASEEPYVQENLSGGPIACLPADGVVVATDTYLPFVTALRPDGEEVWSRRIESFALRNITSSYNGTQPSVSFEYVGDIVYNVVEVGGGYVAVQIARGTPTSVRERRPFRDLHTYVIEGATGDGVYAGTDIPHLLHVSESRIYFLKEDPYPVIHIHSDDV